MLLFSMIAVFIVSMIVVRVYLPRMSGPQRMQLFVYTRLAAACAFALIAVQGHPEFWVFTVGFVIFASRAKAVPSPID